MPSVNEWNDWAERFYLLITSLTSLDEDVSEVCKSCPLPIDSKSKIIGQIVEFLRGPVSPVLVTSDGKQEMHETSWLEIISEIRTEHFHKRGDYVCSFHTESLWVHSLMSMVNMLREYEVITEMIGVKLDPFFLALLGFLHDIGKVGALCTMTIGYGDDSEKVTGYPYHGELGSGILSGLYHPDFPIKREEWSYLCRAIAVHMCGYHASSEADSFNALKWRLYRLESQEVKNLLVHLSVADVKSCIPDEGYEVKDLVPSREHFCEFIGQDFVWSEVVSHFRSKGMIIMVRGTSCSGKSTMVNRLVSFISEIISEKKIKVLERDRYTIDYVCEVMGLGTTDDRMTGNRYQEMIAMYHTLCVEDKKLTKNRRRNHGHAINQRMIHDLEEIIRAGGVAIIDSMALLYQSAPSLISSDPAIFSAFRVAIDIHRNCLLTETDAEKNGLPLVSREKMSQVKLFGARTLMRPMITAYPKRGGGVLSSTMTSLMTASRASALSDERKRARPHLVHVYQWGKNGELGWDAIENQLHDLVGQICSDEKDVPNYDEMEIVELIQTLVSNGHNLKDFFSQRQFICHDIMEDGRFYLLRYRDGLCKTWNTRWARQCRGTIVYISPENGEKKVRCVKRLLQRGAEMLTTAHEQGTATQEMSGNGLTTHQFDETQEAIRELLTSDRSELIGYVSGKRDGSLLGITLIPRKHMLANVYINAISQQGGFAQTVLQIANDVGLSYIPVFSSQNTLFLGEDMWDYMAHAIAVDSGVHDDISLRRTVKDEDLGVGECLRQCLPFILCRFDTEGTGIRCYSFEAVVAQRTTAWGRCHRELTIDYQHSSLALLGVTTGLGGSSPGVYHPHFVLTSTEKWSTPWYHRIQSVSEIHHLIEDLDGIVDGGTSESAYREKYSLTAGQDIDLEGYVLYTNVEALGLSARDDFDYSKVKTPSYYRSHKFRRENVPYLIGLNDAADRYYPLVASLKSFLARVVDGLMQMFTRIIEEAEEMKVEQLIGREDKKSTERMRAGFTKANANTKKRIALAKGNLNWIPVFEEHVGGLREDINHNEVTRILRRMAITRLFISRDDPTLWREKLSNMLENHDDDIIKLFEAVTQIQH